MTDEERLKRIAIKTFKQHWGKIVRILERGKITYKDAANLFTINST